MEEARGSNPLSSTPLVSYPVGVQARFISSQRLDEMFGAGGTPQPVRCVGVIVQGVSRAARCEPYAPDRFTTFIRVTAGGC